MAYQKQTADRHIARPHEKRELRGLEPGLPPDAGLGLRRLFGARLGPA